MKYLVWIILITLIIFRYFTTRPVYKDGDKVRVTGVIYSDPILYENARYIKLEDLKIYVPIYPEISYGDKVVLEGTVDSGKIKKGKLISVSSGVSFGANFRNKIISFYQSVLPEPYAGLIAGVTLGSKGALTANFWEMVKNTGVAHVVVASGTNVTFVVSFLISTVTLFLPRRKAIPFVILGIILYLFISGFDAPLIRAAVMALVAFLAIESGRMINAWRNLVFTALIMLIYNPDWIIDIGFILSFVSTASIMLFERKIRTKLNFLPKIVKEGLSTSLAAQIGVTPILFVTFGQFNIWSPVINALILWTIPFIMILGVIGGVVGLIIPILGKAILFLTYPVLWWFVSLVNIFS
ncbi:MAG: ComEC/Rec2 family competence protein [bacterium]|nr:ComEC/Rec2 family competence protein [bacterium]